MSLQTIEEVDEAIREAIALPMTPRKAARIRAGQLADLFEVQARLYTEAGQSKNDQIPAVYRSACFIAAARYTDRANFFRTQAGAR